MGGEKTLSIYEKNGKIYKFLQSFYWSKYASGNVATRIYIFYGKVFIIM